MSNLQDSRRLLTVIYLLTAALGVVSLISPSNPIEGTIGASLTFAYGLFLLVGGLGCLCGILRPNYRFELNFLWGVTAGYSAYAIALWSLAIDRVFQAELTSPFGPALAVTALALFFCIRLLRLYQKNKELIRASDHDRLG